MDLDSLSVEEQSLVGRIKHYLITITGRTLPEASVIDIYQALAFSLREEIMTSWAATRHGFHKFDKRRLYYLSMEYLPGRIMANQITNLNANTIVKNVVEALGFNLRQIIHCEMDPGLGNGGLGRLASCFLDSLATMQMPAMAYGLRYQYGMFEQEFWDGVQIERPDCWLLNRYPWDWRQDAHRQVVEFGGLASEVMDSEGRIKHILKDCDEVRAIPYDLPIVGYSQGQRPSTVTLRLWSTKESPRNFRLQKYNAGRLDEAAENTALTDVLYPVDEHDTGRRARVKQELLLVSASVKDILHDYQRFHNSFDQFPDKVRIQINDTHPAMVIAELMRQFHDVQGLPWEKAFEMTRTCCSYTNHTIMREALEEWDQHLISYLAPRQYQIIDRLNAGFLAEVRQRYPNDEDKVRRLSILQDGRVRMAHLAIYGSHKVNGVAKLHTSILKERVFKDFVDLYPDRFMTVTNGVTQRRWLLHSNPKLAQFITERIGDGWVTDFRQMAGLKEKASDASSLRELMDIKKANKKRLIRYIQEEHVLRDHDGNPLPSSLSLDPEAIFDVQIKRVHEYKRQLMNALHLIMLYHELQADPNSRSVKRVVIFGGKAAAGYEIAKIIVRLIHCIARRVNHNPDLGDKLKIVYLENYNVSHAERIICGADLSQQISTAGMEASGTGNMKLAINGALTIGTNDGANIEMKEEIGQAYWPFEFGRSAEKIAELSGNREYRPWDVYNSEERITRAVDALRDGSLAENDEEHRALSHLYRRLLEGTGGQRPDPYFVLADLASYAEVQKRVEEVYLDKERWANYVLHNIAGMGNFSADVAIHRYCEEIWKIKPQPLDPKMVKEVQRIHCEHSPFCTWDD